MGGWVGGYRYYCAWADSTFQFCCRASEPFTNSNEPQLFQSSLDSGYVRCKPTLSSNLPLPVYFPARFC